MTQESRQVLIELLFLSLYLDDHLSLAEDGPALTLTTSCCGLSVKSVYHLEPVTDFPARPTVEGRNTTVPKETFAALGIVAECVSTDATRYILNGVYFTPEDGGRLIATDGRRLAGTPARVPSREFVLPTAPRSSRGCGH